MRVNHYQIQHAPPRGVRLGELLVVVNRRADTQPANQPDTPPYGKFIPRLHTRMINFRGGER
jgi:hypothetical protein